MILFERTRGNRRGGGWWAGLAVVVGCGSVTPAGQKSGDDAATPPVDAESGGTARGTAGAGGRDLADASLDSSHSSNAQGGAPNGDASNAGGILADALPPPWDPDSGDCGGALPAVDGSVDVRVNDAPLESAPPRCGGAGEPCCAGNACSIPHASSACSSGVCTFGLCDMGYDDCNHDGQDGCEVNLDTDSNHCGRCGHTCASDTVCGHSVCDAKYVPLPVPPALTHCTNVALGADVTASSTGGGSPSNVVDGDRLSEWNAGAYPSQSITITLPSAAKVSGMTVKPLFLPGGQFGIRTLADNTVVDDRKVVFTETTDTVGFVFASPTTAAIAFQIQEYEGPSWVAFSEIALWKCDGSVP